MRILPVSIILFLLSLSSLSSNFADLSGNWTYYQFSRNFYNTDIILFKINDTDGIYMGNGVINGATLIKVLFSHDQTIEKDIVTFEFLNYDSRSNSTMHSFSGPFAVTIDDSRRNISIEDLKSRKKIGKMERQD